MFRECEKSLSECEKSPCKSAKIVLISYFKSIIYKTPFMNAITEKYTEKSQVHSVALDYVPKAEKTSKKQYRCFTNTITNDLAPELLEAHIIALMGNALS